MRILVTGGAGFIGSHVVDRLLGEGHTVTVVDDFNDYYNPAFKRSNIISASQHPAYRLVEGDICNVSLVKQLFSDKPDMVIHLAARAGVRASVKDPYIYQEVNVKGTLNILESMQKTGVKKITFGSTSSVYGLNTRVPFSETDAILNIAAPYAATKIAGEALCRAYHNLYGIDAAVLRFFSVYGERGRPDMAIYQFTERILKDQPITVYGDGSTSRDYTHVEDIVQGIVATVKRSFGCEIINLGDSKTVLLGELISLIEEAVGKKAKLDRQPDQPGDVPRTFADISKAQKLLGYQPRVLIAEGVKRFVKWYRAERERTGN